MPGAETPQPCIHRQSKYDLIPIQTCPSPTRRQSQIRYKIQDGWYFADAGWGPVFRIDIRLGVHDSIFVSAHRAGCSLTPRLFVLGMLQSSRHQHRQPMRHHHLHPTQKISKNRLFPTFHSMTKTLPHHSGLFPRLQTLHPPPTSVSVLFPMPSCNLIQVLVVLLPLSTYRSQLKQKVLGVKHSPACLQASSFQVSGLKSRFMKSEVTLVIGCRSVAVRCT